MKTLKKIPSFKNEAEERAFWEKVDSTEYVDWSKATIDASFPNLKPSTKTISLRLSESMLANIKILANRQDIPYQSYIKVILDERLQEEMRKK